MREIKFRVWDGEEMWNPETLTPDDEYTTVKFFNHPYRLKWGLFDGLYQNRITSSQYGKLMQYTGLKDKNGKEIYEGDILKGYGKEIKYFIVSFRNGSFELNHYFGRWGLLSRMLDSDMHDMPPEIIGNIYENPGLCE